MNSSIPAIDGYTYKDVFNSKSDKTACRLQQCNNLGFMKCSQGLCRFSFCSSHATHKHFICEYCLKNHGTQEIIVDQQLACNSCVQYLLKTRCCKRCDVWLTKERAARFNYCYDCSSKCVHCQKSITSGVLCDSCERTQRACYTQGITGFYGQFK